MVRYTETGLQINIPHEAPKELRKSLLLSLSAAIRWACLSTGKKSEDDESLHLIAELQEQIISEEL